MGVLNDEAVNEVRLCFLLSIFHLFPSRFCNWTGLGRIDKLLHLGPFLVDCGHMFGLQLLINGELLLCMVLLSGANVVLADTVMGVWRVGIQLQCALVLRKRLG